MIATTLSLALGGGIAYSQPVTDSTHSTPTHSTQTQTQSTTGSQQGTSMKGSTSTNSTVTARPGGAAADASTVSPVDLKFETDSSALSSNARDQLQSLATWVKCNPDGSLILEGHADPRGTQDHNMKLSAERAGAVRQQLIGLGVGADRIVVTVYGENGPKRDNFAEERRVTVRPAERPITPDEITASR